MIGASARTVVVAVGRVFGDRGEHHLAVRQGGGIGEGEWNAVDSSEIDGLDCERLDRAVRGRVQRRQEGWKRKTNDAVRAVAFAAALEQPHLIAADGRAFDVELAERTQA